MKYLKKYEHINPNEPKFKVGDIVYYKKTFERQPLYLKPNTKYTIKKVYRTNYKYIIYTLEEMEFHSFVEECFISELEYTELKYNL